MSEALLLGSRGILKTSIAKNKENITLRLSTIFYMNGYVPKVRYGFFVSSQWYRQYQNVCMERILCIFVSYVTWEIMKMIYTNIQILLRIMRQKKNFKCIIYFHQGES